MNPLASSHLAPIRACRGSSPQRSESSETMRIFNRMSTSELSLWISKYGVASLPRLANHSQRIKAAMMIQPCDEPQKLAEAVAAFQKEFDRIKREELMTFNVGWGNLRPSPVKPAHRTKELHPCLCCGQSFHPLKLQVTRGNGLWCSASACRAAARESRKRKVAA